MCTEANSRAVEADEPAVCVPPRFWWLKRIGVACALLVVLLAGMRWWWGRIANHRLQTEIDRIHAAGEPILPEDFDSPPVPDAEDAIPVLSSAVNTLVMPAMSNRNFWSLYRGTRWTPAELADAQLLVDANTNALRLARQARDRPLVDWGVRIRSPAVNFLLPPLSRHRQLCKTLAVAARHHHHAGNDAEAVAAIRDQLALGNVMDRYPSLIAHLIALSINALAAGSVENVAPNLAVNVSPGMSGSDGGPASRSEVVALIDDLLDERVTWTGCVRAFQFERMLSMDTARSLADGTLSLSSLGLGFPTPSWESATNRLFAPIFVLDGVEMLRIGTAWMEAVKEPTFPAMLRKWPPEPANVDGVLDQLSRPLSTLLLPSLDHTALLHYRLLGHRRMAAVALAIRLYEVDHGRRPERLADLVPDYLDAVPPDPFDDHGRCIGYRPDADPPVLYSVGADGVDDSGAFSFLKYGGIDRKSPDAPFFLDGIRPQTPDDLRPTSPASTQSADKDRDVANDERDDEEDESGQPQPENRQPNTE